MLMASEPASVHMRVVKGLNSLFRDQSGATAIEYVLIAGIIAVGLISGLEILDLPTLISGIADTIAAAFSAD